MHVRCTRRELCNAGLAVGAAVALGVLVVAPGTAAAPTTTVVSKQYRYSMVVPGSPRYWTRSYAFLDWTSGDVERGEAEFDTFTDTRTNRFFIVGARKESAGTTLASWTKFFTSFDELGCKVKSPSTASSIAGRPARVFSYSCGHGISGTGLTTLNDKLGYFMLFSSSTAISSPAADRPVFQAGRRSFRFLG
jgi:hypothetical protein